MRTSGETPCAWGWASLRRFGCFEFLCARKEAGNRAFKSPLDRTDDATANDTPAATTCAADTGSAAGQASRASMSCHIPVKLHNENRDSVYALAKKTDAGLHR